MTTSVECVFATPSGHLRFNLIVLGGKCDAPGKGFCRGENLIGITDDPIRDDKGAVTFPEVDQKDERWPVKCSACGKDFGAGSRRSTSIVPLYSAPGMNFLTSSDDMPPGWMLHADWMPERWCGADGICLAVKLPDGKLWIVDGPSSDAAEKIGGWKNGDEGGWKRNGVVPRVTATPSIDSGTYHGWLRDGKLVKA